MSDFFRQRYPAEAVWTFFGIGNRDDAPGILSDVHRETKVDGHLVDTWLPGALPGNHPATKAVFLRALREEILPRIAGGGTLYLFVGDHGELSPGKNGESAVTLWQLRHGRGGRDWVTDEREILTVTELRTALAAGLGRGRVVFCMTQCHSGGFHFLGVPRDLAHPETALPRVAGFAATNEESLAAGCMADPDPDTWEGYERFVPQALLGTDLMSGERRAAPLASFAAAHEAATLVDRTIDLPASSSDQYLERWATHIETKLARTLSGTEPERRAVAAYAAVVDGRSPPAQADPAYLDRVARFRRFTAGLAAANPATAKLLGSGTRRDLEVVLDAPQPRAAGGGRRGAGQVRRLWTGTLRPAWTAAVKAGKVASLPAAAVPFEIHLLQLENGGRDFFSGPGSSERLLNEVYWESGLFRPTVADQARAEAVPRWAAVRYECILAWAQASGDAALRNAAATVAQVRARASAPAGPEPEIDETAVERVLFYRRVLGAWNFLLATDQRGALAQLAALIETENTPLPPPTRK